MLIVSCSPSEKAHAQASGSKSERVGNGQYGIAMAAAHSDVSCSPMPPNGRGSVARHCETGFEFEVHYRSRSKEGKDDKATTHGLSQTAAASQV